MPRFITWSLLLLSFTVSGPALAQNRGVIRIEEIKIEAKVQKPEVMILITRQDLNDSYTLELKESFLPKIVQAVDEKPF